REWPEYWRRCRKEQRNEPARSGHRAQMRRLARSPAAQSERSSCNSGTNCIRNPFKQRPGCHNEAIFNSLLKR
ncbi:hypothetical protein, partial [Paraburkholderia sp. DGU8]|uniref:hypothetical protein n=1 Tax=Paraburkholderia sp. DGU8 TaxID=3161997 RepID=UPI003464F880